MSDPMLQWVTLLALLVLAVLLLAGLWLRRPPDGDRQQLLDANERMQRGLRDDIAASASITRQELTNAFTRFQQALQTQGGEVARTQNAQIDQIAQQVALLQKGLSDTLNQQLRELGETNARRLGEMRAAQDAQLAQLQQSNSAKLDEMRKTVDEKLQTTLETRLGESFKLVAERLDQVQRGLGEMQTLATGVGDLKRVLTNVKSRGIFGEVQLAALLEQALAPDQYGRNVQTRPGSGQRVEFAVRFPGHREGGSVWLPIDAKFPREDYERLLDAQERADAAGAEQAARALETRIRLEARAICDSYLEAPYTTDFALMFLPTEGLYAEVLRRPGLMEALSREHHVTLAGPTTLLAILTSLQMGFRTLALEKQASHVWDVLGAVKTEFGKFGDVVTRLKTQTQTVLNTLDSADTRTRQMQRALKSVEALPEPEAQRLLPRDAETGAAG